MILVLDGCSYEPSQIVPFNDKSNIVRMLAKCLIISPTLARPHCGWVKSLTCPRVTLTGPTVNHLNYTEYR